MPDPIRTVDDQEPAEELPPLPASLEAIFHGPEEGLAGIDPPQREASPERRRPVPVPARRFNWGQYAVVAARVVLRPRLLAILVVLVASALLVARSLPARESIQSPPVPSGQPAIEIPPQKGSQVTVIVSGPPDQYSGEAQVEHSHESGNMVMFTCTPSGSGKYVCSFEESSDPSVNGLGQKLYVEPPFQTVDIRVDPSGVVKTTTVYSP